MASGFTAVPVFMFSSVWFTDVRGDSTAMLASGSMQQRRQMSGQDDRDE